MRVDEVRADAFGPFVEKRFRFAPGMTVVFGPNEAGKSSLHAALYAGVCGRRRGKGQRAEEKEFATFHRPWDNAGRWAVGAMVTLSNGRRVELHHDLEGKVACRAIDSLGRDVSAEIMYDGSPDGSRWVGLDRQSFLSTACVGQADVFAVVDDASELQEELQRAAASGGKDETAAKALASLAEFRSEMVGKDQANSIRPLRRARERLGSAQFRLEEAKKDLETIAELTTQLELATNAERDAYLQVRLVEAAVARRESDGLAERLRRVKELSQRFAGGAPPDLPADDELAEAVARAVQAWTERPSVAGLSGPSSHDLERELQEIPTFPEGDLEIHERVSEAFEAYQRSDQALELHELSKPAAVKQPVTGTSVEELQSLARDLAAAEPSLAPELEGRLASLRQAVERSSRSGGRRRWAFGALAAGVVAGTVAFSLGATVIGVSLLVSGILGCILLLFAGGEGLRARQLEQLLELENACGERRHAVAAVRELRSAANQRATALGLAAEVESVRQAAEELSNYEHALHQMASWEDHKRSLGVELRQSETALDMALAGRGENCQGNPRQSFETYRSACTARAALAQRAAKRPFLEDRLGDRLAAEKSNVEAVALRDAAEARIREVAARCGLVSDGQIESLLKELELWKARRQENLKRMQADRDDWSALATLMAGKTVEEIGQAAATAASNAERAALALDPDQVKVVSLDQDVGGRLAHLRSELADAIRKTSELKGKLEDQRKRARSVAEAEEAVSRAEAELARVQRLDETLAQTERFLERAQERVHYSIAPALRAALNKWLPRVTHSRYIEALVDPENLDVKVRSDGGTWREARLLSQGTAEQVYLLLRIALVEHLTRPSGEVCPLILDDVMVQSDESRKVAFLELLHELSSERQVILFTMEPSVADWAKANLHEPNDLFISLDAADIAA